MMFHKEEVIWWKERIYSYVWYCTIVSLWEWVLIFTNLSLIKNGVNDGINLIPTFTITEYIVNFSSYNTSILLKFFANFGYFVPFVALFFPYQQQSNKEYAFSNYIILFFLVFLSDFLPRIFKVGVFDIDAVLLRYLGAVMVYRILIKRKLSGEGTAYNMK